MKLLPGNLHTDTLSRLRAQTILVLCLGLLFWLGAAVTAPVAAQETEPVPAFSMEDTLSALDLKVLEEYTQRVDGEISQQLEQKPAREWLLDFVRGEWELDAREVGNNIVRFFFKEVTANSNLLGKLLILAVISALLINLQTAFSSGVSQVSYLACFLALCALALGSFKVVLDLGINTVNNMVGFMIAMLPQMLVLTAGMGNVNSTVTLFPLLMTTATAFASTIKNLVFPLIILSAILHLVNNMSTTMKVERMAKFFTQMAQICLGFLLTFFVGILTLRALYASVLDKVTLRTTRFVTDNAIPVVGKMFSDTIEVAAGYILLLKQALGIFGVLVILGMILLPLIKIAALGLIYKVSAAIAEPLGDSRTSAVLEIMSTHLFLMLAAVAAVGLMFFIMIAIVIGLSSGPGMAR